MQVKNRKVKREEDMTAGGMGEKKNQPGHSRRIYSASFCSEVVDWIWLQTSHYWHVAEPIADLGPRVSVGSSGCDARLQSQFCAQPSFWLRLQVVHSRPAPGSFDLLVIVFLQKSNPISDKTVIPISLYSFATKRRYRAEVTWESQDLKTVLHCGAAVLITEPHHVMHFLVSWGRIATIFMADIIASHKNHDVMNSSVWAVNSNSTSLIFIQHLCLIWAQPPHLQNPA